MVPVTTYYVTLQALESTKTNDVDKQFWLARFISFAVMIAMWIILSLPVVIWKYLVRIFFPFSYCHVVLLVRNVQGKVRVTKLGQEWTRSDALAAPSYGAAPVWKASTPGLFRDAIVRASSSVPLYHPCLTVFSLTGANSDCSLDQEKPL